MDYLDLISDLDATDSGNVQECEKSEKTPCEHPLHLPESKAIGRCIRCQSEEQFVDTLAKMRIRRERTARAVDARVKELERSQ